MVRERIAFSLQQSLNSTGMALNDPTTQWAPRSKRERRLGTRQPKQSDRHDLVKNKKTKTNTNNQTNKQTTKKNKQKTNKQTKPKHNKTKQKKKQNET